MAVVVFPTPPFWLAMAIMRLKEFEKVLALGGSSCEASLF
jgi:hypothetical protein